MTGIVLVVQSDDFGMCHAVNTGIVRTFTEGVLTQASVMVPCPWFEEAASLAQAHAIPVGVHCTLTAEWDNLRYRPLTGGASLRAADGTFHRTIRAARESIDPDEATGELTAQAQALIAAGLDPGYFDCHMGVVRPEPYERVSRRFSRPFLYGSRGVEWTVGLTSVGALSERGADPEPKLEWLLHWIADLGDGTHLLRAHCAEDTDELDSLARHDAGNYVWTRPWRISDVAVLTDPRVRDAIRARGIRLAAVKDLAG